MENVGGIHAECARDRAVQFQEEHPSLNLEEADHIKMGFAQEGASTEWMWVKITSFDDAAKKGIGKLDNEPLALTNIEYGDEVKFKYSDIVEVL